MVLLQFDMARDGIVVAGGDGFVHLCLIGGDIGTDEHVVDAEIHAAAVVAGAGAVAAAGVGIVQRAGEPMVDIGDGGCIEVAAHDDVALFVLFDECSDGVGLHAADGVAAGEFAG